ncbi:hypothetical protein MKW98_028910, partial [Papaver atlanticum]
TKCIDFLDHTNVARYSFGLDAHNSYSLGLAGSLLPVWVRNYELKARDYGT